MGIVCTLPLPHRSNFHYLIQAKIYSLDEIREIKNELSGTTLTAHSHSVVALSSVQEQLITPTTNITTILSMKSIYQAKKGDFYDVGQWVFRVCWRRHKRFPTREEVREGLEQVGEVDTDKMEKLYKCISRRFDERKISIGRYIDLDTQRYGSIDISSCLNRYPKSYRSCNITPKRLAIGMDYIRNTIMGGVECAYNAGKELTVSTDAMSAYSVKLWKMGIIKKKDKWGDALVSRAIRYILEEYGDLEKLDADHNIGVSMRYMITPKYHAYKQVANFVGMPTIGRIRAKGMASVQEWDSMGNTA